MAMHVPIPKRVSKEEYLERERHATTKSEYLDGIIVAMAGASPNHNRITVNLIRDFSIRLEETSCEVFGSDMRVSVPECNRYYYPDISVACQAPSFEEEESASLLDPVLLIEVLSPSTKEYDRVEKWLCYQTIPSLQAYLLVSYDSPRIEVYQRVESGWHYQIYTAESTLSLPFLPVVLAVNEVYRRVIFTPKEPTS